MRALKLLGGVIGGLIALTAVAAAAILLLVDPNDYKDRIAQAAERATGRTLVVRGDIALKLFPNFALSVGEASLGNPEGFGPTPFATLQHIALRVDLLPLLRKELKIGRIEIDGLDLQLARNGAGKGNWEDFGQKPSAGTAQQGEGGLKSLELEGLRVTRGHVQFGALSASEVDLDVGRITPGAAVPVKLSLGLQTSPEGPRLRTAGSFSLTPDLKAKRFQFTTLALDGTLSLKSAPKAIDWRFSSASLDLDLAAQTLSKTEFDAQLGLARLSGSLSGQQLIDALALRGEVDVKPIDLRGLMTQFGVTAPVTRDATVLKSLAMTGRYAYAKGLLQAENLDLRLDATRMRGRLGLDTGSGAKTFDLSIDGIDIDRYLPPPTTADKQEKAPFELPVSMLKGLHARGVMAANQVTVSGVKLSAVKLGIDAHDGQTQIAPLQARLYDGECMGTVRVDTRPATPTLSIAQTFSHIDMNALLGDFAKTRRLSGRGSLVLDISAQGTGGDALMKSLRGKASASLAGGAIEGIDLWHGIAQAQSLIQNRRLAATSNTKRTTFDSFRLSADILEGVATTQDLTVLSPQLRVTGKGSTNLVTQALDFGLDVTVLKAPVVDEALLGPLTLATIPVKVSGSFAEPKIRPDFAGMVKAKLQKEVEKRKEQVKETVRDALKGLFGR